MNNNAVAYLHRDGALSITHDVCGSTQIAQPIRFDGTTGLYTSDAHYCRRCDEQGLDTAALNYPNPFTDTP